MDELDFEMTDLKPLTFPKRVTCRGCGYQCRRTFVGALFAQYTCPHCFNEYTRS